MTRIVKRPKTEPAKTRDRPRIERRVIAHVCDEVVVISADKVLRPKGYPTGEALIAAMQASPDRGVEIAPERMAMPVRKVAL
jgi:hypothetical protein